MTASSFAGSSWRSAVKEPRRRTSTASGTGETMIVPGGMFTIESGRR